MDGRPYEFYNLFGWRNLISHAFTWISQKINVEVSGSLIKYLVCLIIIVRHIKKSNKKCIFFLIYTAEYLFFSYRNQTVFTSLQLEIKWIKLYYPPVTVLILPFPPLNFSNNNSALWREQEQTKKDSKSKLNPWVNMSLNPRL